MRAITHKIPKHDFVGRDSSYWIKILEDMISKIKHCIGCSRADLKFTFNSYAYREIFSMMTDIANYTPYDFEVTYNPKDLSNVGTILGVDFVTNPNFEPSSVWAIIRLEVKEKYHWMDDYFKTIESNMRVAKVTAGKEDLMKIKKVIFNDPATIVFWSDGSKTVVKCMEGETFDPEKGILVAWYKKLYGDKPNYMKDIKKFADSYNQIVPNESFFNFDSIYVKGRG